MSIWIAGADKPHRCPKCWRCSWAYGENWRSRWAERIWRVVKYLPRRCQHCGCLTITTRWAGIWGIEVRP